MTKFLDDEWMYEHGFYDRPADDHVGNQEDWCVDCRTVELSLSRPHMPSRAPDRFISCSKQLPCPVPNNKGGPPSRWLAFPKSSP
jgi:hypothetical protein